MSGAPSDDPRPEPAPRGVPDDVTRISDPGDGASGLAWALTSEREGDVIGPFTLLSQLGEGGFGTVWLAERREPFVQRVALKIVKAGMDTKAVVLRFEQERQALAVMNHPNVARVIDGGITPGGRPYFAMEYVKGDAINAYADSQRMTIEARLRLFTQVCEAVQHAHSKGIIHRDLKPSNVLVARLEDGTPQVKVIDFGVAKALSQDMAMRELFTETGQMIGTPEYMSPEQAEPGSADIDTRSDVYSLGVMLYELLTGMLPFEPKDLRSKAFREIQRIIREVDPPTPSTRLTSIVTQDTARASAIAAARRGRLEQLAATLRGELEWIPLKAMRKERDQRYSTPVDLARDIGNYLEGRPLTAGPEAISYRMRKYVRRHRTAVATASIVAASLVVATVASTIFGIREATARRLAEQRERDVMQVLDFQHRQLASVGQEQAGLAMFREIARQRGNAAEAAGAAAAERDAVRARVVDELRAVNPTDVAYALIRKVILEQAMADAEANHRSEPFLHAGLLMAIGRTYHELGDYERAREIFSRARAIWEPALGPGDRRVLHAREWMARSAIESDAAAALDEIRAVCIDRERLLGPGDPDTLDALRVLAGALARAGRQQDAVPVMERVRAAVPAGSAAAAHDLAMLGRAYMDAGQAEDAERALLEARARIEALPDAPKRLRATVLSLLGLVEVRMEDPAKIAAGVDCLRRANQLDEEINGEQHASSFDSRGNLAVTLMELAESGKGGDTLMQDALALHEDSRRIGASLDFPPKAYFLSLNDLANWKVMNAPDGDPAARRAQMRDALRLGEEAYRTLSARSGPSDDYTLQMRAAIGLIHMHAGDPATAERVLREVSSRRSSGWTPGFKDMVNLRSDLAMTIAAQGRWDAAVHELDAAQRDAERELNERSEARWRLANRLLGYLGRWRYEDPAAVAQARIEAQRATVERLRAARASAGNLATEPDERWWALPGDAPGAR